MQTTTQIAVYGTLKRGFSNAHWLEGAEFVGGDRLHDITLYDLGPYPAAVEEPSEGIDVEVYRVSSRLLKAVDRLEDADEERPADGLYRRCRLQTRHGPAWVYLYNGPVADLPALRRGAWRPRDRQN